MAQNIDELQIEIQSDATDATRGLDNLAKSLEKLKKAVDGSSDTAKGLKSIASAMRSIGKVDNLNLAANIAQLRKLNNVIGSMQSTDFAKFQSNMTAVASGITELSKIPTGNIPAVSASVRSLVKAYSNIGKINLDFGPQLSAISSAVAGMSATSERLNSVDFSRFGANVAQLSKSLQPLQGFKTQASGLLTALRGFPETAAALNDFSGFDKFSAQVQTLAGSLAPLGNVNSKLGSTIDAMSRVSQVANSLDAVDFSNLSSQITSLANALTPLQNVNSKLGSTLNNLSRVGTVSRELSSAMSSATLSGDINKLVDALSGLNRIEKGNLGAVINQLKKIPEITKSLDTATLDQFAAAIQRLTEIMGPLAAEMASVSNGFSVLPSRMNAVVQASNRVASSNKRSASSFGRLTTSVTRAITKLTVLGFAFNRVWNVMSDAFNESNEYIENLNLFTVTMGDATESAMKFATKVQDLMGIDISEWIENQGAFMRMATGFGIASDQAALMSQNLVQLAYDMSSFFNTDVETAMQKLQSGMSGQIKGLKIWGYNLSVAALQETALSLGIEQSVRTMTEAQKAQLRYITLIQKSYGVMGDMSRTLITPANSLRILNSRFVQLKRALGDIVSVIAVKVIPYVQVLVNMLTEAANKLAAFLGFELPTIDYSSLELGSDVIDGIGDDLDDTTEKAKELKKQLMGFDELNILKSPSSDDDDKSASYDLGIDLPEYDFLAGLTPEMEEAMAVAEENIRNIIDGLKDVAKWAAIVGGIFLGWKIATGFATGMNAISTLLGGSKAGSGKSSVLGVPSVKTVLKGMADLAIVVGGAVVLVEALGLFMKIPGVEETARDGIELLGVVFSGLYDIAIPIGLASVAVTALGKAGVGTIAKGFSGFAIVLGGTATLVTAVGALLSIPGFDTFLSNGVDSLKEVFNGLSDIGHAIAKLSAGLIGLGIASPGLILSGFAGFAVIIGGTTALITAIGALLSIPSFGSFLSTGISSLKDVFNGLYDIAVPIGLLSATMLALGFISPGPVISGFAGFAVIVGGTTGLITAIGALLSIPGFDTFLSGGMSSVKDVFTGLYDIAVPIGALSAMILGLGFASPGVVLSGLAGFTLIVGGMEALLVALGALKQIPGFTWIIDEGASVMNQLGNTIGGFAGSIVGGFAAGMSSSLPEIGQNLADFMTSAAPFFAGLTGINSDAVSSAESIAGVILALVGANVLDSLTAWITGGSSLSRFGEELAAFAPYFVQYANTVSSVDASVVTASASAAQALSELANNLPNSGGVASWFAGENDLSDFGAQLPGFGKNMKDYADAVSGLDESSVTASANAGKALAELATNLPNSGGLVSWFTGDNDLTSFGDKLPGFGANLKKYADSVSGIDDNVVTASANAAKSLAELAKNLPNSGGLAALFAGDNDISSFGAKLPKLGSDLKAFSDNAAGIDPTQTTAAVSLLERIVNIANKMGSSNGFDTLIGKLGDLAKALSDIKMPTLHDLQLNVSFRSSYSASARKVFDMIGLPGAPVLTWNAYAEGGFPTTGEMFIARERGPEMVGRIGQKSAVANNDQITQGIASAVYEAMMAAQEEGGSGGNTQARIVVQIGDRAVGEAAVEFINGQIRQTGKNPINY